MTPAARDFYDLEGLWRNGEPIPMDHIVAPRAAASGQESSEPTVGADEGWGSFDPVSKVRSVGRGGAAGRGGRGRGAPPSPAIFPLHS